MSVTQSQFSLPRAVPEKQSPVRTACATRLPVLLLLLLTLPAVVQAQFNYTTINGTITITGYDGPGGEVAIPDTIDGLPVTRIGDSAFSANTSLTSVTIPDSVTRIGDFAFYRCTSLTSVTIPNSVTIIGNYAFYLCTSLTSGTIPNSVTSIGGGVFFGCASLTSVTMPDSAISIGNYTFYGCASLTSVMIPISVIRIGTSAFHNCISLTDVTIPGSVTSIGNHAFHSCASLTSVTIPSSVTSIGDDAFSYCTNLSAITVDALNTFYSSVDGVLFNKSQTLLIQCPADKAGSYAIPNSVTSIRDAAFAYCTSLTSVTIPNTITSIGGAAFRFCTGLTSVTIPSSVTYIGILAFDYCTSLTGIYFEGNAPIAAASAFEGANNLTVYYLPGTTGWGTTFAERPTVLWNPLVDASDASFGVRTNRFGFTITGASNLVLVVEASTSLANPAWIPVGTNTLIGGSSYFSDPEWANHPARFYRLRSP